MAEYRCENCGAPIERRIRTSRLVACTACNTTQMLVDDVFRNAGTQGVMLEVPGLLTLGRRARLPGFEVEVLGHLRFSYGPGWWDEYWCDAGDKQLWISVDEGDIAIERPMQARDIPRSLVPGPGAQFKLRRVTYTATEVETAECIALRGELPEAIAIGERHAYVDFTGDRGEMVTYERWEGAAGVEEAWYTGTWIDPWEVEPLDDDTPRRFAMPEVP
ncbi:MAG: DUF4178 domain-containing protein [Pseudomonadota bacterium]